MKSALFVLLFSIGLSAAANADDLQQQFEAYVKRADASCDFKTTQCTDNPDHFAADEYVGESLRELKNYPELLVIAKRMTNAWGDTILEGEYVADGNTQLESVVIIKREWSQPTLYYITYFERALWIGSEGCARNQHNKKYNDKCAKGRLVESVVVSLDLNLLMTLPEDENREAFVADSDLEKSVEILRLVAHNSNHRVKTFDAANFGYEKEQAAIVKLYRDGLKSGGCVSPEAVVIKPYMSDMAPDYQNKYLKMGTKDFFENLQDIFENDKDVAPQIPLIQETLLKLLTSSDNMLVIYSGYGDGFDADNSESCLYFRYHIYRKDGRLVTLDFNYTD
jgi:hypothetical protein